MNAYIGSYKIVCYRDVLVKFKDEKLYISTQFFDSGRGSIISLYERHK